VTDRLRLVMSSHTFLPTVGGAELGVHEIAKRLGQRHEVTVLAPGDPAAGSDYGPDGYQVLRVSRVTGDSKPFRARLAEYSGWAYARALIKLHRSGARIDAVNCHFIRRHALLVIVARGFLRIPVIVSLVGRSDVIAALPVGQQARAQLVLRTANAVVANSAYYLRGSRFADSAHIVPYGVDLVRFRPGLERTEARDRLGLPPGAFVILAVQRLEALKRVDLLVRALAEVLREVPGAKLLVAGTGSQERRLRELADELGIGPAVIFTGYVAEGELPALFGLADVFASHSESETFGVTFAEAMAAGLPIVVADTSCVRDVLTAATATIVPAGDVREFANAVVELARRPDLRAQRGASGRARAEREFDWQTIADAYEQLIVRCLSAGSARRSTA
jgi:glycosyltransferase involved in cell wall biosynthesis